MNNNEWHDANNQYLAASLDWLRAQLRLAIGPEALAMTATSSTATAESPPAPKRRWFGGGEATKEAAMLALPAPAAITRESLEQEVKQAAAARESAAQTSPAPALLLLAESCGLSSFERDALLMCAAAELDPAISASFARLQRGNGRGHPSFGLALQVLSDSSWDALSPYRPLRYSRLIEINQPGATPLTEAALRADERILNYLKGLNALDERLALLTTPAADAPTALAASQESIVKSVLDDLQQVDAAQATSIHLLGTDPASKLAVAQHVGAVLNRRLYRLSLDALPTQRAEIESFARLWQRESVLLPIALYVDADELDAASPELANAFHWFLSRDLGLVFVAMRDSPKRAMHPLASVSVARPTPEEQYAAWLETLPAIVPADRVEATAKSLAGQFDLNLHEIEQVAGRAARADTTDAERRLWTHCRELSRPRLDLLAQRLDAKATWVDLVLPAEATSLLRQIVGQVRERHTVFREWGFARRMNRGLGTSVLFAGESGTGKTMAAEVIANELDLALYRIDLSAVVSKYIGETERNLRKLFDAAEQGGAILFFDEADALFGKRSEVKDSHDRYANIEINYLLQRMESFSGLAILATNMKSALDTAFLRRLRFVVNFQYPGVAERMRIWRNALPQELPSEPLDLERLARFNLSGGNIHGIALNAAFLAASRGEKLAMPAVLAATRAELRKLEKQINEADFRTENPRNPT